MSSASSSIETPALTRRTLDWLSTSLLKGISREALRVIFWLVVAIVSYSATGAESLSLDFQPVTETGRSPLALPSGRYGEKTEPIERNGSQCPPRKDAAAIVSSRSLSTMLHA